mgnify:CR=1 FL=1
MLAEITTTERLFTDNATVTGNEAEIDIRRALEMERQATCCRRRIRDDTDAEERRVFGRNRGK